MTRSISPYAVASLMLAMTLGVLTLQVVLMAFRQLEPSWGQHFAAIVPIAGVSWLALATLLFVISRVGRHAASGPAAHKAHRIAVRAASFMIAGKFVLFEIGKLRHNSEMEQFFLSSGYPARLHYLIVALELLGTVGILLPGRRVRRYAAMALLLIMGGAVATHLHNGDPLSDSYDAILQALYLLAFLGLTSNSGWARFGQSSLTAHAGVRTSTNSSGR